MKTAKRQFRTALVYDRVNSWGGAEKVLLALHRLYPDAPLYTSVYEPAAAPWAKGWRVRTSWLQHWGWARRRHRLFGWLMPLLFASFDLSGFDLVISVTSESAKAVRTSRRQLHVCYLLTPTRYLWSHQRQYLAKLPGWSRPLARLGMSGLRLIDRLVAQSPDIIIPISNRVGARARRFYRRRVEPPLYPPVDTLGRSRAPKFQPAGFFIFAWGRQVEYKRFDLIIRAAAAARVKVVIAGCGPETPQLERLAALHDPRGRLVRLVGQLSAGEIQWYLERAAGAVFPQEEDFGIAIMEAQLAGCPVVVHPKSGAAELLRPSSGVFLEGESLSDLVRALRRLRRKTWRRLDIARQARHYAGAYFATQWRTRLKRLKEHHEQHLT